MDFDKVLKIFEEDGSRDEFLIRLKNAGENSEEFNSLKNVLLSLGMYRTSRHVHQSTLLQHTFQYSEPFECFTNFRLVCKSWKFAVDTKPRFDHVDSNTVSLIDKHKPLDRWWTKNPPVSYVKAIQSLKKITLDYDEISYSTFKIVMETAQRLESFSMEEIRHNQYPETYESYVKTLLTNSHQTLKVFDIPRFVFPEDLNFTFSKLTCIAVNFCDKFKSLSLQEFQHRFQNLLALAPKIKTINIDLFYAAQVEDTQILEFLGTVYGKHCMSCTAYTPPNEIELSNYVPVKVLTTKLDGLAEMRYADKIEFLHIMGFDLDDDYYEEESPWHNFKNILISFSSLKGICFHSRCNGVLMEKDFHTNEEYLDETQFKFWEDCLAYTKSIGIKILDGRTFYSIAPEISKNLPWNIHFNEELSPLVLSDV